MQNDRIMYKSHSVKNTGLCVSVPSKRMSVCFIGNTTSEDQFMDTLAHELYHVQSAICEYYDVPPDGEDAAWTMGFLMRKAVRLLMLRVSS